MSANDACLSFCAPPESEALTKAVFERSTPRQPCSGMPQDQELTDLHDSLFCDNVNKDRATRGDTYRLSP